MADRDRQQPDPNDDTTRGRTDDEQIRGVGEQDDEEFDDTEDYDEEEDDDEEEGTL